MTNEVLWTVRNAGPEMLGGLSNSCAHDGGTFTASDNGDGTFTAVCTRPVAGTATISSQSPSAAAATPTAPAPAPAVPAPTPTPALAPAPAPAVAATGEISAASPDKRFTELSHLHPVVRKGVKAIQKKLDDENIPMRVFEALRSPQRQQSLYNQGRTTPGDRVTNAEAWESYHQYGMAADFVRFENNKWNWNDKTSQQRADWARFHEIARENGLEPLSWEMPHVQIMGVELTQLRNGL